MKMWQKIWFWAGWILVVWVGTMFGLNYYEQENNCIFEADNNFPFVYCRDFSERRFNPPTDNNSSWWCNKWFAFSTCVEWPPPYGAIPWKPLILLYAVNDTQVNVTLDYDAWFSATYPEYNPNITGWSIIAHPDGTVTDLNTSQETYGLFWEWNPWKFSYDLSKGFIIKGSESREFLYETLREIGLTTKEYSDFIMFWYPKLKDYPYVQITFAGDDYADMAKLNITPKPDSLLRVYMVAKPLSEFKEIQPQEFKKFERNWFSVVEWGGTIIE